MTGEYNRIIHIYTFIAPNTLTDEVLAQGPAQSFESSLPLGRFTIHLAHLERQATTQFRVLAEGRLTSAQLSLKDGEFAPEATYAWRIISDCKRAIQLHMESSRGGASAEIAQDLSTMCHQRHQLLIDGLPLPHWTAEQISAPPTELAWEQDVLQIVAAGAEPGRIMVRERVDNGFSHSLDQIILRDVSGQRTHRPPAIKSPGMLNLTADQAGSHGRGVLAVAGQDEDTVNAIYLTAATLLAGLSRLRIVRRDVTEKLKHLRVLEGDDAQLNRIQDLTEAVRKLQLDLTVGVETYIDGIHLPELVVDEFRKSFQESLGLITSLISTQSLLESLSRVSETYLAESRTERERRSVRIRETWQIIALVASAVIFPFGLLLSYFGMSTNLDIPPETSAFDMNAYGVPWLITLLSSSVILVIAVALSIRNRLRSSA